MYFIHYVSDVKNELTDKVKTWAEKYCPQKIQIGKVLRSIYKDLT
jgi:hypothetical protein